jgi:hypothetical protein
MRHLKAADVVDAGGPRSQPLAASCTSPSAIRAAGVGASGLLAG